MPSFFRNEENDDNIGARMTVPDRRATEYDESMPGVTVVNETINVGSSSAPSNMYFNVGLVALGVFAVFLLSR